MTPAKEPPAKATESSARTTPAERAAAGKAARSEAPRSSHADWAPAKRRKDPVAQLESQAESRVPELVPIRYGRMARSAFAFFRGAAAIMAADLAPTPTSGLRVQLCGDAHLSNFGGFASPEREMLFDINDFDETLPGPWEWDVKRLAASLCIAGRDLRLDHVHCREVVVWAMRAYREAMRGFAEKTNLQVWYARLEAEEVLAIAGEMGATAKRLKNLERNIAKARAKDSERAVSKLTEVVDGELRFISAPPLVVPLHELLADVPRQEFESRMADLLDDYRASLAEDRRSLLDTYRFQGIARKVVGVGSVGTRAWVVLMVGRDEQDPLVLQCKEAQASVLEPYAGASDYANSGQRVVEGQRLMQAASDIFLGWLPAVGLDDQPRDFYVRQLWDGKLSVDIETMEFRQLRNYGRLCGWTLARAHARTGDRIAIAGYLGKSGVFEEALADFSTAYADQNELDYKELVGAIASGRIEAQDA
ncbi:MAG: DUF2252 domain-containing protein [Solirubrobacterales bacterium]